MSKHEKTRLADPKDDTRTAKKLRNVGVFLGNEHRERLMVLTPVKTEVDRVMLSYAGYWSADLSELVMDYLLRGILTVVKGASGDVRQNALLVEHPFAVPPEKACTRTFSLRVSVPVVNDEVDPVAILSYDFNLDMRGRYVTKRITRYRFTTTTMVVDEKAEEDSLDADGTTCQLDLNDSFRFLLPVAYNFSDPAAFISDYVQSYSIHETTKTKFPEFFDQTNADNLAVYLKEMHATSTDRLGLMDQVEKDYDRPIGDDDDMLVWNVLYLVVLFNRDKSLAFKSLESVVF